MWMNTVRFSGPHFSSRSSVGQNATGTDRDAKDDADFLRGVNHAAAEANTIAVNNAIASDQALFLANRRAIAEKKYQATQAQIKENADDEWVNSRHPA